MLNSTELWKEKARARDRHRVCAKSATFSQHVKAA